MPELVPWLWWDWKRIGKGVASPPVAPLPVPVPLPLPLPDPDVPSMLLVVLIGREDEEPPPPPRGAAPVSCNFSTSFDTKSRCAFGEQASHCTFICMHCRGGFVVVVAAAAAVDFSVEGVPVRVLVLVPSR